MKTLPHRSFALSLLLALPALGPAMATPLDYREAVQGDLPDGGLLPVLALDLGSNQVLGTVSLRTGGEDPVLDYDHFAFSVAPGQQLVSLSIALADALGDVAWVRWTVWQANSALAFDGSLLGVQLQPFSPGTDAEVGSWGQGLYQLRNVNFAWFGGDALPLYAADYRIELAVRPVIPAVPEPAGAALLAAGLLTLAWRRRALRGR